MDIINKGGKDSVLSGNVIIGNYKDWKSVLCTWPGRKKYINQQKQNWYKFIGKSGVAKDLYSIRIKNFRKLLGIN